MSIPNSKCPGKVKTEGWLFKLCRVCDEYSSIIQMGWVYGGLDTGIYTM